MKLAICMLLLVVLVSGQTTDLKFPSIIDGGPQPTDTPSDKRTVLLIWSTIEKCYECGTRYLMNCSSGNDDCNVPPKTVLHYGWFPSKTEALASAESMQVEVWGLFDTSRIAFERTEEKIATPQPDRIDSRKHYKVKP